MSKHKAAVMTIELCRGSTTTNQTVLLGWVVLVSVVMMVFGSIYFWSRNQHQNQRPVELGAGKLEVVYITHDGVEHAVDEATMHKNLVMLINRIQDQQLRREWQGLCRQFQLPRHDPKRFFYVSWSTLQKELADGGRFGVAHNDPRPGCLTLYCNYIMLVYPERAEDPEMAGLQAEVALVHELQHINDWQFGRLTNVRRLADIPAGLVKPGTPNYDISLNSRVEMFATELRAIDLEFSYVRSFRSKEWSSSDDGGMRSVWYKAWGAGRVDEFRSLVYDGYEQEFFPPQSWKGFDRGEMKTWMLGQVAGKL